MTIIELNLKLLWSLCLDRLIEVSTFDLSFALMLEKRIVVISEAYNNPTRGNVGKIKKNTSSI